MQLSPADRQAVLRMAAERAWKEIKDGTAEGLEELLVLPLATAAHMLALSPKATAANLPTVKVAAGKRGVTLAAIRAHIAARTVAPTNISRKY